MTPSFRAVARIIVKIIIWAVGILLFLIVLLFILIQLPAVQNFAKNKIVQWVEQKIHTHVSLKTLSIKFPQRITLDSLFIQDEKKDTLIAAKNLEVQINLWKLLRQEINIPSIKLEGVRTHIYRIAPDTSYNFEFIIRAFASSSDSGADSTATSSSWNLSFNTIHLKNIHASFQDDAIGNKTDISLGNFLVSVDTFDLQKMRFSIPRIIWNNTNGYFLQYQPTIQLAMPQQATNATSNILPAIHLKDISFQRIGFLYADSVNGIYSQLNLGKLNLLVEQFDLNRLLFAINTFNLSDTKARFAIQQTTTNSKNNVPSKDTAVANWLFSVKQLNVNNNEFRFDNNTSTTQTNGGINYNHLFLQQFSLQSSNLLFTPTSYKGNISQLTFQEQSGFALQKCSVNFLYSDTAAYLQQLFIQTPYSVLKRSITAHYPSLQQLTTKPEQVTVAIDLNHSIIGMKDVLFFQPSLQKNMKGRENETIQLHTQMNGSLQQLTVPVFELSGLSNTRLSLNGNIKEVTKSNKAFYNVTLKSLSSSAKDVNVFMPSSEQSFRLPEQFTASGFFKGTLKDFKTELSLRTNRGNINTEAALQPNEQYNAQVEIQNIQAGYLLKQEKTLQNITAHFTAKGKGFNIQQAEGEAALLIDSATLNNYTYKNITANARVQNKNIVAKAMAQDKHLAFNLEGKGNFTGKEPSLKLHIQLDTLEAQALHFTPDTLNAHVEITADIATANVDSLTGFLLVRNLRLENGKQKITTDSIVLNAERKDSIQTISLYSEIAKAVMKGNYELSKIGNAFQQTLNTYYPLGNSSHKKISKQQANIQLTVLPSPLLWQIMPSLKGSDSIALTSSLNTANSSFSLNIKNKRLIYEQLQIDSFNIAAKTEQQQLKLAASVNQLQMPSLVLYNTLIEANVNRNNIHAAITLKDAKNKTQYLIATRVDSIKPVIRFSLIPDSLILDYNKWYVAKDNFIQLDTSSILVHNFSLQHGNQNIKLQSNPEEKNAPLEMLLQQFQIATLTKMAHQDSLLIDGTINGTATVKNIFSQPTFTGNIGIDSLSYKKTVLGNLLVKVNNEEANTFNADVSLKKINNNISLKGSYNTQQGAFNLLLQAEPLNLSILQPFVAEQVNNLRGNMHARINLQGTIDTPKINGTLRFDSATITSVLTGEPLFLKNETIRLNQQGVHFSQFTLLDSAKNKAVLNGDIFTKNFKQFFLNANLHTRNFRLINTAQATGQPFYGKANIDADAYVRGNMNAPNIEAFLLLNKETNFFVVLPSSNPEVVSREGVVIFTDSLQNIPTTDTIRKAGYTSQMQGANVSANIETDSSARFTLIIDERNGDALTVRGLSDLSLQIDRSGKLSLTGNYELTSGSYNLSLNFLKKRFDIQKGSTIIWTGDPTSANINITAVYTSNAAPIDLIQQQLAGRSSVEVNRFKEKLPFQVLLKMKGELLKPIVSFDIVLPEDELSQWPEVDAKLQQLRTDEAELNKQVFALLLLNRFMQENPFESAAGGGGIETAVRQSASRILTDQLNQLVGNMIQGVDINFDVASQEDYSTGTAQYATDVNVSVSKGLMNDRLRVNVGSSFQVEGPQNTNRQTSNIAGDVSVDYKLSKDGRYMLRVYRINQYEGVLEGQVIETGASFIVTFDYNKFKELFQGKKQETQRLKAGKNKNSKKAKQKNNPSE